MATLYAWLAEAVLEARALVARQLRSELVGSAAALYGATAFYALFRRAWAAVRGGAAEAACTTYVLAAGTPQHFAARRFLEASAAARASPRRRVAAADAGEPGGKEAGRRRYALVPELRGSAVRVVWRGGLLWARDVPPGRRDDDGAQPPGGAAWYGWRGPAADGGGSADTDGSRDALELVVLTLGFRRAAGDRLVHALLEEGHRLADESARRFTQVFTVRGVLASGAPYARVEWQDAGRRPSRPLDSVVLADGLAEAIESDARRFLAGEQWYAERGIPYRRGYLFTGRPGGGKTSLVKALAGELRLPIYILDLASGGVDDAALHSLLGSTAPRSVVLIEDIDEVLASGARQAPLEPPAAAPPRHITRSGLLNALDGVAAQESRLLFLTSNSPATSLDAALVRPGRVDVRAEFGPATRDTAARLFERFYRPSHESSTLASLVLPPKELAALAAEFARCVEKPRERGPFSMAELQGHLMQHADNPQRAVQTARELDVVKA